MAESAAAIMAGEKHGILFGPERTGLDNDDIALASAILTFPVNPAYGSLNLAQAVLLCGYEFFKARQGGGAPFDLSERSPPAQREMTLSFFEFLEEKLDAAGFFRPATKRPVMQRNMRNMLHRMNLSQQDVRTLWGAIVRLVDGPRVKPQTRKRIRQPKAAREPREPGA
jgi:tRNA/rRNA methyltransferase